MSTIYKLFLSYQVQIKSFEQIKIENRSAKRSLMLTSRQINKLTTTTSKLHHAMTYHIEDVKYFMTNYYQMTERSKLTLIIHSLYITHNWLILVTVFITYPHLIGGLTKGKRSTELTLPYHINVTIMTLISDNVSLTHTHTHTHTSPRNEVVIQIRHKLFTARTHRYILI